MSFGYIKPSVDDGVSPLSPGVLTGNVGSVYALFGLSVQKNLNSKVSSGFSVDQPFGADRSCEDPDGYFIDDTEAHVATLGAPGLVRYKLNDSFSVLGGRRIVTASGFYNREIPAGGGFLDDKDTYMSDMAIGHVAGVAFEKPEGGTVSDLSPTDG